jgi:hypothetical protein
LPVNFILRKRGWGNLFLGWWGKIIVARERLSLAD